jgi:hypothetical protein
MALTTRREFVQQTALAAASLCGGPMKAFAGTRRMFAARDQNVPPLDAAAIRKLASQVRGNVITPETCNLRNQSDVCVRRGCRVRVH